MKKIYLLTFTVCILFMSCQGQVANNLRATNEEYRNKYLARFDKDFVGHFPDRIVSPLNTIISAENVSRGFVGMLLYEYEMKADSLIKIEDELKSIAIKKYNSDADCLLVINRFDTNETYVYPKNIILSDSVQLNKSCYETLLPIPKFFDYENEISNPKKQRSRDETEGETMLPPGFNIYVLEAKPGNHLDKYDIGPNRQMPDGWKNGYSKGVAISVKYQTIIYWSVAF